MKPLPVKDRPKCRYCGKQLKPEFNYTWFTPTMVNGKWIQCTKEFNGNYGAYGNNHFCTQRCGFYYAVHMLD